MNLTFRQAAPPTPPEFALAASLDDWTAAVEFVGEDGSTVRSSIPAGVVQQMEEVLTGKEVTGASSPSAGAGSPGPMVLCPRLAGPICYEFELHDIPVGDAGADPDLDVFYRLRFYSGLEAVRVAFVVENTRIPRSPAPARFTVADRSIRTSTRPSGTACWDGRAR